MIVSRRLVSSGRKLCLFVYYVEQINNKQWMCRNPNLAKCGGEAQHLEKLGIWSPPRLPNV